MMSHHTSVSPHLGALFRNDGVPHDPGISHSLALPTGWRRQGGTHESDIAGLSFLIVDDNRHMRNLVKSILHAFGVKRVSEAEDGADALRELRTTPSDVVITDWVMEPVNGIELVRLLRTGDDSPNPLIPIIMLTGHTEYWRIIEARDAGVNELLAKPISAAALHSRLRSLLEHPRPFIRTTRYIGPDRRRRDKEFVGDERRFDPNPLQSLKLTPAEIAALWRAPPQ